MDRQVICIRWGTKYGADYVNRLYGMVARNITPPFRFACITDTSLGLRPEIDVVDLPELGCEMPTGTLGIWGKSRLWAAELGSLSGPALFIDLDVVITGSLDGFFEVGAPEDVILARNPNTPFEKMGQTSIFRYPIGGLTELRAAFQADPQGIADEYKFEQRYVTRNAPGGAKFWPRGWVSLFKWHCIPPVPLNYFQAPKLPQKTKVVIFPGPLNPPDALAGRWREKSPHLPPMAHIAAGLRGERRESLSKHLRHYLKPAPWIADHWRA
ncbi:MAG: glycosyl transferase [Pseudomonadota bacterium]